MLNSILYNKIVTPVTIKYDAGAGFHFLQKNKYEMLDKIFKQSADCRKQTRI